jgi:hypothetical protein
MTRFIYIPEYEDFFKSLKLSLSEFGNEYNVTPYSHFAEKLHIKGNNKTSQFSNLINPYTGKDLKVRELILTGDNLHGHQKHFLDYLCNRWGYICSEKAQYEKYNEYENIKDIIIKIGGSNGSIFSDFIAYTSDNELDNNEIKSLIDDSYRTRALLAEFEENLKLRLKDEV